MTIRKKGKSGNAKHGRGKRKPSHVRYNATNRREKNKEKKLARLARKAEKKALK
jgi:hypothetical protein